MKWVSVHCGKLMLHWISVGVSQVTYKYILHTERLERLTKQFNDQAGEGMAELYIAIVQLTLTRNFGLYSYFISLQTHSFKCFYTLIKALDNFGYKSFNPLHDGPNERLIYFAFPFVVELWKMQ